MTEENRIELDLPASITVADVTELKGDWVSITGAATDLTINGKAVQRVDSAGLQLLLATVREVRRKDGLVSWSTQSEALDNIANILGMTEELGIRT